MVQVVAACPSEVLDFCVPLDQGESASKAQHGEGAFVYAVRLTLEDPTARIHAFLYGEDAVRQPSSTIAKQDLNSYHFLHEIAYFGVTVVMIYI